MRRLNFVYILLGVLLCACGSAGSHEGEEGEEHGHGHGHNEESFELELTQAQMDAVGIRMGSMEQREMADMFSAPGTLEVDPGSLSVVTSRLPGTVSRITVVEGQRVSAGQTVAVVESPELLSLRQEYELARQEVETARMEFERQQALASQGAGIRKNLDIARAALSRAELTAQGIMARIKSCGATADGSGASLAVKADISGVVTSVSAEIGSYADMQLPLATIANTDALFCRLNVLEKDVARLAVGMGVEMRLTNNPDVSFSGKVADVTPLLDATSRTVPVRVALGADRPASGLVPGMAVNAALSLGGERHDALPEGAVVSSGGKSYIFVLEDKHEEEGQTAYHFEKREVMAGTPSGGYVPVTPMQPLEGDALIVVEGAFYLNSMASDHGEHSH